MGYKKSADDVYTQYYLNQAGSGFGNVYSGGVYQKGHGIGSFLGGLFRCVYPLLKSGSSAIGSELLKTGINIASDISRSEDPELSLKKRGKETINNLSQMMGDKMFGKGYKLNLKRKSTQSAVSRQPQKKQKKKNQSNKNKQQKKKSPKKQTKKQVKKVNKNLKSKEELLYDIFGPN